MPKVTDIRPAGPNHQVLTVVGGDSKYCIQPCADCPWRKDAKGVFPAEAFRHSANTAYDMSTHTFACHTAGAEKPAICAGFLLNGSVHNLAIRLMLVKGKIELKKVGDGGHELYPNYRAMAVANGVKKTDPVLKECRD